MKNKKKKTPAPVIEIVKSNFATGELVRYYDEGVHHGYIEKVNDKKKLVTIKPIGARGSNPHCITVSLYDVQSITKG